jgi:hypothetical protein
VIADRSSCSKRELPHATPTIVGAHMRIPHSSVRFTVLGTMSERRRRMQMNPIRFSKTPESVPRSPSIKKTLSMPMAKLPMTSVARSTAAGFGRPRATSQNTE